MKLIEKKPKNFFDFYIPSPTTALQHLHHHLEILIAD